MTSVSVSPRQVNVFISGARGPRGITGNPGGNVESVGLFTDINDLTIPPGTTRITTSGRNLEGEGATVLFETASTGETDYRTQSDDGRWWLIGDTVLTPEMFGARGGNATYDDVGLAAMFAVAKLLGRNMALYPGRTYITTEPLEIEDYDGWVLDGQGATIKAQDGLPVVSQSQQLRIHTCSHFEVRDLVVDGNRATRSPVEGSTGPIEVKGCTDWRFTRVRAINSTTDGFYIGATTEADSDTFCKRFVLDQCEGTNAWRNGCSIINGWDWEIRGGYYTAPAGGHLPMAGIDVESNTGADEPGNRSGLIKGVTVENCGNYGIQVVGVANTTAITIEDPDISYCAGAILNGSDSLVIRGGFIHDITEDSAQGASAIQVGAQATATTVIDGVRFRNITGEAVACIDDGSISGRTKILNCVADTIITFATISADNFEIKDNVITTCSSVGISINSGADYGEISGNRITAATGRAILSTGSYVKIRNNYCIDVASVAGAYIQAEGLGNEIVNNHCRASTSQATTLGIRGGSTNREITGNTCINLHTTDPYTVTGGFLGVLFGMNVGGTQNGPLAWRTPIRSPYHTDANRPAANTVIAGGGIYNVTDNAPNFSDGTNWRDAMGTAT